MEFFTIKHHEAKCPRWPTNVTISVKYRLIEHEDPTKPTGKARYVTVACPIRQNEKLRKDKRDPKYAAYAYCPLDKCPHLDRSSWDEITDTRIGGSG